MASRNHVVSGCFLVVCGSALAMVLNGCHTAGSRGQSAAATEPASAAPMVNVKTAANLPTIRVDAGSDQAVTDSTGVKWSADTGFDGGDTVDRPDLKVTGTDTPELYHTERYSMDDYHFTVPNGNYLVRLHFSEDYDGITSPDDRKFSYTVKDGSPANGKVVKEVKNFSPWGAAGAQFKAYVDTVPVSVTNGEISITFTADVENPQINAIEILPQ